MDRINSGNIHLFNQNLRYEDPAEIISFALEMAEKPLVTTSFGPFSAAILHAVTSLQNDVKVIWCDTGYNTDETYQHANYLIDFLRLKIDIITPRYTTAFLNNTMGRPDFNNPNHAILSEEVKLNPFKRAMDTFQPDVWFTNVRQGQTVHRSTLDILSLTIDGTLKVSPFYYHSDDELEKYLTANNLPVEFNYFDPVKALEHRECGIHLRN